MHAERSVHVSRVAARGTMPRSQRDHRRARKGELVQKETGDRANGALERFAGTMMAAPMGRHWVEPPKRDMPTYAARWHAKQNARVTHAAQITGLKTPSQKRTGTLSHSFFDHQQKSYHSHIGARGWLCIRAWVGGACVCNGVDAPCTRPSRTWPALRSQKSSTSPWRNTWRAGRRRRV